MGSNIIHFLDLYIFLSKRKKYNFNYFDIKNKLVKSNERDFLNYKLKLVNNNGDEIIFEDYKIKRELKIKIKSENLNILVNESKLFAKIKNKKFNFKIPFQSDLSQFYCKKIERNKMDLPDLEESQKSHEILFNLFKRQNELTNKLITQKNFNVS